jgi:hypothetical protein
VSNTTSLHGHLPHPRLIRVDEPYVDAYRQRLPSFVVVASNIPINKRAISHIHQYAPPPRWSSSPRSDDSIFNLHTGDEGGVGGPKCIRCTLSTRARYATSQDARPCSLSLRHATCWRPREVLDIALAVVQRPRFSGLMQRLGVADDLWVVARLRKRRRVTRRVMRRRRQG